VDYTQQLANMKSNTEISKWTWLQSIPH